MRHQIKSIYFFVTMLFETIISCIAVLVFSSFSINFKIKKALLNKRQINCCNVLGNGPSLDQFLSNDNISFSIQNSISVNFFCNSAQFITVKPNYYVISDPSVFNDDLSNNHLKDKILLLFSNMSKVDWDMILFIPYRFRKKKFIKKVTSKYIKVILYNDTPVKGFEKVMNLIYKYNLGMPISESVLISAIYIGINLKFKNIKLYGVDHSWLKDVRVDNDNSVSIGFDHFNGETNRVVINTDLTDFLLSQARLFNSHRLLKGYAEYSQIDVFNMTENSYIDSYCRVPNVLNTSK